MNITRDEARRIAALAHLEFDDDALDRMAEEMTKILSYIDQLREVDGATASAGDDRLPPSTPLREDTVRPGVDRDAVAKNAPAWRDGHFVVPKVIE
jgi:aspartyl-tRNA(Asn)/glutamyl-tRNA(Gln) amidotransferase subunit C